MFIHKYFLLFHIAQRFPCASDNFSNVMLIIFKFGIQVYMGDISPEKEIGIDFLNFVDVMRSKVMKSALFFHYPCVRFRFHK